MSKILLLKNADSLLCGHVKKLIPKELNWNSESKKDQDVRQHPSGNFLLMSRYDYSSKTHFQ